MSVINHQVDVSLVKQLGRVGVLYGGQSSERDISLQSGQAVADALQAAGVEYVMLDTGKSAITDIQAAGIDRAFIALHGPGGEDGRIQAVLEYLQIPYTGSDVQSSALAMDKLRSKQLWRGVGLSTPDFELLSDSSDWQAVLNRLGGDVMVKPAHEGSSIGMARVSCADDLAAAYRHAAQYDQSVLAEKLITGAEYTVAVLDGKVLPPIRLETDHRFYDFDAKYLANDTRYLIPCGLSAAKEAELKNLVLQAFNAIGCKGWARLDVMADQQQQFYLLEVNTVPGMTSHSLVPMAANAEGLSFNELVLSILRATL